MPPAFFLRAAMLADTKLANTRVTATGGTAVNVLTGTSMNIDANNSVLSGSTLLKPAITQQKVQPPGQWY